MCLQSALLPQCSSHSGNLQGMGRRTHSDVTHLEETECDLDSFWSRNNNNSAQQEMSWTSVWLLWQIHVHVRCVFPLFGNWDTSLASKKDILFLLATTQLIEAGAYHCDSSDFTRWDHLVLIAYFSTVNRHCCCQHCLQSSYISTTDSCLS